MEDHLLSLLRATQSPSAGPRQSAEHELARARTQPGFALALATLASHASITPDIRQAALLLLRTFVDKNWGGGTDPGDEPAIQIDDASREQIRGLLLALATGNEEHSKVRG